MNESKPVIGISMGDPAGIGPEICVKAAVHKGIPGRCNPIIFGDASVIQLATELTGIDRKIHAIKKISDAIFDLGYLNVFDLETIDAAEIEFGEVSAKAGHASFLAIKKMIEFAVRKEIDATVTAPIHKKSINLAGHEFAGHTEIFAKYTGSKEVAMLLADGDFRVIHVSTHVSLRKACDLVKKDRILHVLRLLHDACKQFGIDDPKIAVCGLNPHASDSGLFGFEEQQEIIPAINIAVQEGIKAEGPFAADTLFSKVVGGFYDGCVAMYHDQGHIPFKVKGFVWNKEERSWGDIRGVNITLGIPIIRVSVDHGTAFDIAGKGVASEESMIHAIDYAIRMSENKTSTHRT